ncbi:MAG TPA: Xaa-Pro peptidase family protein [Gaiellaceae bacterium]
MTDRIGRVQASAAESALDALLLVAPPNLAYVSGFFANPHERLIALVVPREGKPHLVVPSLEEEAAHGAVGDTADLHVWRDEDGPGDALQAALAGLDGTIGIEKHALTVAFLEQAQAAAPGSRFEGCDALIGGLRAVKDEQELERHRRAAALVDRVVARLAENARPGRTEAELAAECELLLREHGGDGAAFALVLTGAKSALPHGSSDGSPLHEGDLLILDIGTSVEGYYADITRTFVVGREPEERQQELFEVVRDAQAAGVRAATAGATGADVDRAARSVIDAAGLGEYFVHRTGHGLGLEVHEPPYLTATSEEPLAVGNVVTVEPGVYVPGYGGIRIEDDVVVRDGEPEILTRAPIVLAPG